MVAPVDDLVEEMEAHAVDEDIPIAARLQAILSRATGGCDVDKCTVTSLAAPQHSLRDD